MPSNNAQGYPYPVGTDRVMDGDDSIKNLADAVGTKVGARVVSGQNSVLLNNAASGNTAVTFPVGAFTQIPRVVVAVATATTGAYAIQSAVSTSGFTLTGVSRSGSAITSTVWCDWIAHQLT